MLIFFAYEEVSCHYRQVYKQACDTDSKQGPYGYGWCLKFMGAIYAAKLTIHRNAATPRISRCCGIMCACQDLNLGPVVYKTTALPTELHARPKHYIRFTCISQNAGLSRRFGFSY